MPELSDDIDATYAEMLTQILDQNTPPAKRKALNDAIATIEDEAFKRALDVYESGSAAFLDAAEKLQKAADAVGGTGLGQRLKAIAAEIGDPGEVELPSPGGGSGGGQTGGGSPSSGGDASFDGPTIHVSAEDLDALARVAMSEVAIFANFGADQLGGGAAAVVDTIFNRVVYPGNSFPSTIQGVVDQKRQFSAINPLGTWKKLPEAKPDFFEIVKKHVVARANGQPSAIRGACHFLNPNTADPAAMEQWGNKMVENKVASYGDIGGRFVHVHGFAPGFSAPGPYAIEYDGKTGHFSGDGQTQAPPTGSAPVPEPTGPSPSQPSGNALVPADWMPNVKMDRVVCHWTAGSHQASEHDRFCYHILIESDGKLVRGDFSIADNVKNLVWTPRSYAAHTKSCNTRAIGVSVCCMGGAKERPFKAGKWPMTEVQWKTMARVVAELCRAYGIAVTPQTVLGHGEVQKNLGRLQDGKWDPMVLPWNSALSSSQVGDLFRAEVEQLL